MITGSRGLGWQDDHGFQHVGKNTITAGKQKSVVLPLARVNNPRNRWRFETDQGVDLAVNQAELMAQLVVEGIELA